MRKLRIGLLVVLCVLWAATVWAAKALVPETGQTFTYDPNIPPRDDGALQKGIKSPAQRFTDKGKGVIKDNLTGLIWLKNAFCSGTGRPWQTALNDVAELNTSGTMNGQNCGDISGKRGSHATDWRLPNVRELQSLVDYGQFNPALPSGHPFTNFHASLYWSSTTVASGTGLAWLLAFLDGFVINDFKSNGFYVTAVRGGS